MKSLGLTKIFWKIFATFWLVNLAVIFSASYVIVNSLENSRLLAMHQAQAETTAQQLVVRLERGEALRGPGMRRFMGGSGPQSDGPRPQIRILDGNGNVVFQHRFGWAAAQPDYHFEITSDAGKNYRVEAQLPKPPPFFKEMLGRFQSAQFVLILVASTLASALLSYSISQPLKQLGATSREVASGSLRAKVAKKLLQRGDEVGDLARDFAFMIQQVEASLSGQRQLLHDVSHELRAPLARLQVAAALLEKKPAPDYIAKIHQECERMNALIQQILDFSRFNQQPETRENIDLGELLTGVTEELSFQFPERNISFSCPDHAVPIHGYRDALTRVCTNLISNALKFSPSDKPVELTLDSTPTEIRIAVRDYGNGLSDAEMSHVTEPFFRAERHGETEGFGLGLSIVKRGVELHDGVVGFFNVEGGGFLVEVRLPVVV